MNKLVVFDLDGTLCCTIDDIAISVNYALVHNGFAPRSQEHIMASVGNSVGNTIRTALPENAPEDAYEKVLNDFTAHYAVHLCDHVTVYPGAEETIRKLHERGYTLAVVSNKPNKACRDMIRKLFPDEPFSFVLGMLPTLVRKPDAMPLNFVFEYLDGDKNESYYVGDSEVDILFARNAGVRCVSCAWGYRTVEQLREAGATDIAFHFSEVPDIIR